MSRLREWVVVPFAIILTLGLASSLAAPSLTAPLDGGWLPAFLVLGAGSLAIFASRGRWQQPAAAVASEQAQGEARRRRAAVAKAVLDRSLAVVMLVAAAPVMLLAMALVRLTSPGAAIYSQERVGLNGKPFTIYKIRTMTADCERLTGPRWSVPGDPRVTPIGRLLRNTHVDELPQLWNVLRGDLSLVGPRPERPMIVEQLEDSLTGYAERHRVLPGVTGLAQVQQAPDTDLESVRRKLFQDLHYARNASLGLDLRILFATAFHCATVPGPTIARLFRFPGLEQVAREATAAGLGLDRESRQAI